MTPAERAQLTRSTRVRRIQCMIVHPLFPALLNVRWIGIVGHEDMINFAAEVQARLTGGAEV